MVSANQIRKGMIIEHKNDPHKVLEYMHQTPGNLRAFVQVKLRNLRTGLSAEHRFRSVDEVEVLRLDDLEMEYLYEEGGDYYFMDTKTFEQVPISKEILGDTLNYLIPNLKIKVLYYKGSPISIDIPLTVNLKIIETEPTMKGATVTSQVKPAKLETGLVVNVPSYIEEGTVIKVDTTSAKYIERV